MIRIYYDTPSAMVLTCGLQEFRPRPHITAEGQVPADTVRTIAATRSVVPQTGFGREHPVERRKAGQSPEDRLDSRTGTEPAEQSAARP